MTPSGHDNASLPPSLLPTPETPMATDCVTISPGTLMLDLHLPRGIRIAFPYSRLLAVEWHKSPNDPSGPYWGIRFPMCEVMVFGRGLEALREPLERLHVARLAVVDPLRIFAAGPIIVESIVIPMRDY